MKLSVVNPGEDTYFLMLSLEGKSFHFIIQEGRGVVYLAHASNCYNADTDNTFAWLRQAVKGANLHPNVMYDNKYITQWYDPKAGSITVLLKNSRDRVTLSSKEFDGKHYKEDLLDRAGMPYIVLHDGGIYGPLIKSISENYLATMFLRDDHVHELKHMAMQLLPPIKENSAG